MTADMDVRLWLLNTSIVRKKVLWNRSTKVRGYGTVETV